MGVAIRRVAAVFKFPLRYFSLRSFERTRSHSTAAVDSDYTDHSGFEKWNNGGGFVHKSANIDPTALIEIGAVVHPKSVLGPNVHIGSGAVVGPAVTIGHLTKIGYNSALSNCSIGDSCIIHNGACIGQDGFGFFMDEHGNMMKKPQTRVANDSVNYLLLSLIEKPYSNSFQMLYARIGNYVEIGANTCIDRGSWRDTVIGEHSKIDNLVQIGHNVVIGRFCMLCGQVGIAEWETMSHWEAGWPFEIMYLLHQRSVSLLIVVLLKTLECLVITVDFLLFQSMNGAEKLPQNA